MADVPFGDRLSALTSKALADAHGNPEAFAEMIERLTHAVGFTIAIFAEGDPDMMNRLLQGAEGYLYESAANHQKMGVFMARAKGSRKFPPHPRPMTEDR